MKKKIPWLAIIFFILTILLCYFFPYTHDDWDWGSITGLFRLNHFFANFNGRYLGNLLVLLLTRNRILRSLIVSLTLLGIILLIRNIVDKNNNSYIWLSIILLFLMPQKMFNQSIVWTSGFANYVIPVLLALLVIYLNKRIFTKKTLNYSSYFSLIYFLNGLASTLFIEHLTIYHFLLALFFVILYYLYFKKISLENIFYLIGTIIGSLLMFTNSFGQNSYRSLSKNILVNAFETYFTNFDRLFIITNYFLNTFLIIILIILASKHLKKKPKYAYLLKFSIVIEGIYFLFNLTKLINILPPINKYVVGTLTSFYIIASFIIILMYPLKNKLRIILEFMSIFIIAAPLLVVNPIGPRCFLATYVFFVLLSMELLANLNFNFDISFYLKIVASILLIFNLYIYGSIFVVDMKRNNYLKENINAQSIVLPKLPYSDFIHHPDPQSPWFKRQFKQFHHLSEDTTLKFIDYEDWILKNK